MSGFGVLIGQALVVAIIIGIYLFVIKPAWAGLKKRYPAVKWDSLLVGGVLAAFLISMIGAAVTR
jgi:hypothetical protein